MSEQSGEIRQDAFVQGSGKVPDVGLLGLLGRKRGVVQIGLTEYVPKRVRWNKGNIPGEVLIAQLVSEAKSVVTREANHIVYPVEVSPGRNRREQVIYYPRLAGDLTHYIHEHVLPKGDRPPLLPLVDIARFTRQIGIAFDTIHMTLGITHNDEVPQNFWVDSKGNFFLADFAYLQKIKGREDPKVLFDRRAFSNILLGLLTAGNPSDIDLFARFKLSDLSTIEDKVPRASELRSLFERYMSDRQLTSTAFTEAACNILFDEHNGDTTKA